ncbi:16S rRNA (cytidine(1402)-2'-O)-methyltransferase [Alteribacter populi]|uniref:16S rRNA (cytidine(1402)-2'-O)-methyltransferase n=1 Tax=Alteribacter populi TaxID=2011011 RepID=UPI002AA5346F
MKLFIQKSFKPTDDKGCLFLVPTPIGNLDDMTYRAITVLKEANLIAAEDTRNTKKLCHVFEIDTPLISYHEHNIKEREELLIDKLLSGETVALVSDAGMPAISDPGQELVARCVEEQLPVVPLPGANAGLTGLIASGLSTDGFTFVGFLNRKKKIKRETLENWRTHPSSLIFYESPHRVVATLSEMLEVLGNRRVVLSRELTKKHEEFLRGSIEELIRYCGENPLKGECVLLVEGASAETIQEDIQESQWWTGLDVSAHVEGYVNEGQSSKEAIKQTAKDRGMSKREVYQIYHVGE